MKYEKTARRLRAYLDALNMTQQELADRSKINKASISQWINGKNCPGNINAYKLSQVLGASPEYIMGFGSDGEDIGRRIENKIPDVTIRDRNPNNDFVEFDVSSFDEDSKKRLEDYYQLLLLALKEKK